jgi:glycosyltransferase involved in cell wall biosynthesis
MGKLDSISLVSWALNEEENVEGFLKKAHEFCSSIAESYEIIVVDDGSTDKTLDLLHSAAATNSSVVVSENGKNFGVGYSMKRAISIARMDYVIWQTQDWSYDLKFFSEYIGELDNFDILHGARKLSVIGRSDDKYKGLISLGNFLVLKGIFRAPFSDFQNVTLYPREILKSFKLLSDSSFTSPELLLRSWISGYSFLEIPVSFIPRLHGQAKGTSFKAITKSIREIYEFRTKHWRKIIKNSGGPKGVVSTIV